MPFPVPFGDLEALLCRRIAGLRTAASQDRAPTRRPQFPCLACVPPGLRKASEIVAALCGAGRARLPIIFWSSKRDIVASKQRRLYRNEASRWVDLSASSAAAANAAVKRLALCRRWAPDKGGSGRQGTDIPFGKAGLFGNRRGDRAAPEIPANGRQ